MATAVPPAAAALGAAATADDSQQLSAFESQPTAPEAVTDEPPLGAPAMLAAPDQVSVNRDFDPAPLPTFLSARSVRARASVRAPDAAPTADERLAPVTDAYVRPSSSGRRDGDGEGTFTRLLTIAAVVIILALGVATVLIVPGLLAGDPGQTARPSFVAGASLSTRPASTFGGATTSPGDATAPASSTPIPEATPFPSPLTYKIQPGDRLRQIAREFGVTVEQIMAANPEISDPNDIEVGQRIVIPAPTAS
jgi:LysM repeat protein